MFSRFCFFIPATLGVLFLLPLRAAEIRPEAVGSPGWIERYCDRSGGCLTLLNVQPTKPDGTVPGMKCPKCRAAGELRWRPETPEELQCRKCGVAVTEESFPSSRSLAHNGLKFEYYTADDGTRWFLKPQLRYVKSLYAFYTAQTLAREARAKKDPGTGKRALAILCAYSDYYRNFIYNRVDGVIYRPGYPRQCNWGRITHFGDYLFPKKFCRTFRDLIAAGTPISEAERASVRALLESVIGEVTLPFIRQVNGLGNPMGAAYADCISAGRLFREGRFPDFCRTDADGSVPVLSGAGLVHEVIEGEHGYYNLLANYFYPDGLMRERTVAYQNMLIRGLRDTARAAKGYSDIRKDAVEKYGYTPFRALDLQPAEGPASLPFRAYADVCFPDGRSIPVGDDYGAIVQEKPAAASSVYPGWGIGALRLGRAPEASVAVLNWGSGLDGHSHNDMLSLLFWSNGQLMLSAPEYPAHRHGAIREEWWRGGAAAHNTVLIDGENHTRHRGNPLLWADTPTAGIVRAESRGAYPGSGRRLTRTVFLVSRGSGNSPYLLDVFEVQGGRSHDYFLQAQGEKYQPREMLEVRTPLLEDTGMPHLAACLGNSRNAGYRYIASPQTAPLTRNGELVWKFPAQDGTARFLRALLLPDGRETLYCGKAPGVRNAKETDQDRTVDKILRRREGAENLQSRFVTLFESSAVPSGDWLAAERLPVRGNPTAVAVKVMRPDGTDLILTATAPGRFETELDGTPVRFDGSAAVWSQSSGKRTGELVAVGGERFEFGTAGVSAGGVITGRLKSNPGGLGDDPAVESNAVIDVDADLPDECRGRQIFISQANGFESTWKIEALAPLPGGGTRLTLDRPARQAILRMPRFASDGRSFTASGTANLLPGDNCRIGNAWRRIVAVEQAAAGSVFHPWPSADVYRRTPNSGKLVLDRPLAPAERRTAGKVPVSEIGAGDTFRLPGVIHRTITVTQQNEKKH